MTSQKHVITEEQYDSAENVIYGYAIDDEANRMLFKSHVDKLDDVYCNTMILICESAIGAEEDDGTDVMSEHHDILQYWYSVKEIVEQSMEERGLASFDVETDD